MRPGLLSRTLHALTLGLTLAVLAVAAITVKVDRDNTIATAEATGGNLLSVLESEISRTMRAYDISIQGVIDGLKLPELDTYPLAIIHQLLFDRSATADYLEAMLVLGPSGDIAYDSSAPVPRRGNFSDRAYFTVHRERPDVGLYVSAPFASRLRGGELAIAISRRINNPDGTFGGVVVGTLRLDYFSHLFLRLSLGPNRSIVVFRDDGIILAREPLRSDLLGTSLRQSPNISRFLDHGDSHFLATATVDGIERFYNFRHIQGLPLFMNVNLAADDFLGPWVKRSIAIGVVTLVMCLAVGAMSLLFRRELRRREEVEAQLKSLAGTDGLTGVANRRTFDLALGPAMRAAGRDATPLSLLFIDVDRFKDFNDHYGHPAGDDVIRQVAQVLMAHARRAHDLVARYGGEEFVMLLPATDKAAAWSMAESIREAVYALGIAHVVMPGGVCTVSIGLACTDEALVDDASALVALADNALYQAKAQGRNRVVAYHAPEAGGGEA